MVKLSFLYLWCWDYEKSYLNNFTSNSSISCSCCSITCVVLCCCEVQNHCCNEHCHANHCCLHICWRWVLSERKSMIYVDHIFVLYTVEFYYQLVLHLREQKLMYRPIRRCMWTQNCSRKFQIDIWMIYLCRSKMCVAVPKQYTLCIGMCPLHLYCSIYTWVGSFQWRVVSWHVTWDWWLALAQTKWLHGHLKYVQEHSNDGNQSMFDCQDCWSERNCM